MPKRDSIGTKLLGIATRLVRKTSRLTLVDEKSSQESDGRRAYSHHQHPLFNYLSQSNSPPQEHEVKLIQECMARNTAEKNRLITNLQAKDAHRHITRLDRQINSLDLAIQAWKSLLSPVRRLPADILLEVFGYLLVPVNRTSDLPWRLSHVCRYWRDILLSSSTIWRQFPTISPVTSKLAESQQVELVQALIERAPYFIDLCILGSTTNQLSRSVLSLLAEISQKWKRLTISATLHTMQHIFVGETHLESLEELTIDFLYIDSEEGGPTHNITVALFQNAPALQRITLTGEFHGRITLPTSLTLFHDTSWGINSQERLLTIGKYDRLQDLCITDAEILPSGSEGSEGSGRLHLPQLTDLSLKCRINAETGVLRVGVFPSLRNISIDARNGGSGDVCRVLTALLSRSNCCTVETLKLDLPANTRNSRLSPVLQLTPHLKELRCYLPSDPDIQQMALHDAEDMLVPILTQCTFALEEPLWWQVTIDAVQSLIASRCNHPGIAADASRSVGVSGSMVFKICDYDNPTGYPTHNLVLAQTRFETWYTDSRSTPLFLFQQLLGHHLPNIRDSHPHRVPLSQSMVSRAIKILTRIEGYQPRDINEVIMSGAHVILARLRQLSCDDSIEENMYEPFRDQVLRVHDKWVALLSDTLDMHWIWTSPALNEVQYIPDRSAYRKDIDCFNKSFLAMPPDADHN